MPPTPTTSFRTAFELSLPHGTLVAVELPAPQDTTAWDGLSDLLPEERDLAETLPILRRVTWAGGRIALRRALASIGVEAGPILPSARGAPLLPHGVSGSISHKNRVAAAIVARSEGDTVGLDLEQLAPSRPKIAKLVLTPAERDAVDALPAADRWLATIVRFSIKECVFKALDPRVQRYIGFHEASVAIHPNGTAAISLRLARKEGPFALDGQWLVRDEWIVTSVRAQIASTTTLSTFQ